MEETFIRKKFKPETIWKPSQNYVNYPAVFQHWNKERREIEYYRFLLYLETTRERTDTPPRENDDIWYFQPTIKDINLYISHKAPVFIFKSKRYHVMCTRFNEQSWDEFTHYHERKKLEHVIYNVPVEIKDTIPLRSHLFVFELNNTTNEIMGVSYVVNKTDYEKKFSIYTDGNYNRFHYRSRKRISRETILAEHHCLYDILYIIEFCLFKGKTHAKRGHGITHIPNTVFQKYYLLFTTFIYYMFMNECN